ARFPAGGQGAPGELHGSGRERVDYEHTRPSLAGAAEESRKGPPVRLPNLEGVSASSGRGGGATPSVPPRVYLASALTVGASILILLLLVTCLPESRKVPVRTARKATPLAPSGAADVARSFLTCLRLRDFDVAYTLLARSVTERVPLDAFRSRMQGWCSSQAAVWDLRYRAVQSAAEHDLTAHVTVAPPDPATSSWTWVLAREPAGWRLEQLEGLPLPQVLHPPSRTRDE
ncbi:MAG: hypothetical protein AB1758_09870, partial [Candidatus Eremiobacterota bacterium]